MPEQFVSAYANGDKGTVVTISASWAKATGATVLKDEPAVDKWGAPLPPRKATVKPAAKKPAKTAASGGSKPRKPRARKATSSRSRKSTTSTSTTSESSTGGNTTPVAASTPEEASK